MITASRVLDIAQLLVVVMLFISFYPNPRTTSKFRETATITLCVVAGALVVLSLYMGVLS